MTTPAELITRTRGYDFDLGSWRVKPLLRKLASALKKSELARIESEKALAESEVSVSYALLALGELRKQYVDLDMETRPVVDVARKMQEVRARAAADLPNWRFNHRAGIFYDILPLLEAHARMLEAAMPESVQAIESNHADWVQKFDIEDGPNTRSMISILLDAYRVLAAEHHALREKHNAAVSEMIMKVNVVTGERNRALVIKEIWRERYIAARRLNKKERDAARAEFTRLTAESAEGNAYHIAEHCKWMERRREIYAVAEKACKERDAALVLCDENAMAAHWLKVNLEEVKTNRDALGFAAAAETQRADRLAEGVRLMCGDYGYNAAAILEWKKQHGHLVPRE